MTQQDGIDFFRGPREGELESAWKSAITQENASRYALPAKPPGRPWGSYSVRRVGRTLGAPTKAANCYRIAAADTDVVFYRFQGPTFDGLVEAIRVPKGTVRWGRLSGMESFLLQRDAFIDVDLNAATLFNTLTTNGVLPTNFLANRMSAVVHDLAREQQDRFHDHKLGLEWGRLYWDTLEGAVAEVGSENAGVESSRWPYYDYLRFSCRCRGRLKADGADYTITIDLWIEPVISEGRLEFRERFWRVDVSRHIWHELIRREVADAVRGSFERIGKEMTDALHEGLGDVLGGTAANRLLRDNEQLIFTHPCIYDVQRVGTPDHAFSSAQIDGPGNWTTPHVAVAPALRLLKPSSNSCAAAAASATSIRYGPAGTGDLRASSAYGSTRRQLTAAAKGLDA